MIRIGPFELDPAERELRRDGVVLELGGRAFDLLRVLAEHPGRLVTKSTLLERVWPNLVVDENNLSAQVAAIRRVIGAGAIKTVPGFGYRLEFAAGPQPAGEPLPVPMPARTNDPRTGRRRGPLSERLYPLVGRVAELAALNEALSRCCVLTIVGGAGVGKTRLAQELFRRRSAESEAAWVAGGALTDIGQVPGAIAVSLGLALPDLPDPLTALTLILPQGPVLLVLDGVEHLAAMLVSLLERLLLRAPELQILVTSQAPLGLAGEVVYRLLPLQVPAEESAPAAAACTPAVEFFLKRVTEADHSFGLNAGNTAAVAAICRRLDGNPLALELAAARMPSLGAKALLALLDDRFRLLRRGSGGADRRHDTLLSAFEWSHGLLEPNERAVFDRLGAFATSFTLPVASAAVADAVIDELEAVDVISRLVDRSLVNALATDPPRYALSETGRAFARTRLASTGTADAALGRMASAMLRVLDAAYADYWLQDEVEWLKHFAPELDNVRSALDWAVAHDHHLAVALYGAAWPLYVEMELIAEARLRFEAVVRVIAATEPRDRLARFWEAVATFDSQRQYDRARYAAEIAAAAYADAGDVAAEYYARLLLALNWRGNDTAAREAFVIGQRLEDAGWAARRLMQGALTEGAILVSAGLFDEARIAYRRAVRIALSVSERQALLAAVHIVELDLAGGDVQAALQLARPMALSIRDPRHRAVRYELLAVLFSSLLMAGELEEAHATGRELCDLARALDPGRLYAVLDSMAYLACGQQRYAVAARVLAVADRAHESHGQPCRRPVDGRLRASVTDALAAQNVGEPSGRAAARLLDELAACELALGYDN